MRYWLQEMKQWHKTSMANLIFLSNFTNFTPYTQPLLFIDKRCKFNLTPPRLREGLIFF